MRFAMWATLGGTLFLGVIFFASNPASVRGQVFTETKKEKGDYSPKDGKTAWYQDKQHVRDYLEETRVGEEAATLLSQFARTEDEEARAAIKSKLSGVLEKQFDLQQKRRQQEVARIEAQLKKLKDLIRKRSEARQTIIDKRLDQLLREAEGLGWTSESEGKSPYYGNPSYQKR